MAVQCETSPAFPSDEVLGIAIGTPHDPSQRHVGFIYQLNGAGPRLAHLQWHHRATDEPLPSGYCWGASALDSINKAFLAAWVALLQKNSKAVPYGIEYDDHREYFDNEANYVPQPVGRGLTCATFVLAVYSRTGYPILDAAGWPSNRAGDAEWQRHIIDLLRKNGASSEHVAAVAEDVGCVRFRPEEVVAGAISADVPIDFATADTLAKEILSDIGALNRKH